MRITITPKEFATLTGYSIAHAQKLFTQLRKKLQKPPRSLITKAEASKHFNIEIL
jgi:hypothetical protein